MLTLVPSCNEEPVQKVERVKLEGRKATTCFFDGRSSCNLSPLHFELKRGLVELFPVSYCLHTC